MRRSLLLLGGAALLAALFWAVGPAQIAGALREIGWAFLPVVALGGAHQCMRAVALRQCLVRDVRVRFIDALAIRLSGESVQSLTLTGPVLSQPTSAWLLERHGLTLSEAFAATLTEYLSYSFVTAAISLAGLLYLTSTLTVPPALHAFALVIVGLCAAFLLASVVAIVRRFYLIGTIIGWLAGTGVLRGRLRPNVAWINGMEDLLLSILHDRPARFGRILALELFAQALLVAELFWLMRALRIVTPVAIPLVIEASSKGIDIAFLFVPMQMGVSEGAYALVFSTLGLSAAAGVAVALVRRARSLVIAGVGLVALSVRGSGVI
jgi:hypothetical protein